MQVPTGTVTFLFTDIEGSTRLAREQADRWEALRSRHHEILRTAIEQNQGFVFQIIGDAFCAAFHRAADGLKAAVQAQQGLGNEAWGETAIRVRMGLHTGEAESDGQEYRGYLTMSLVQRLMSAGHGGQVLVSGAAALTAVAIVQLTRRWWLGLLGGVAFAVAPIAWRNALRADPHAFQAFLVALLLVLLIAWAERERAGRPRAGRWLVAASAAFASSSGATPRRSASCLRRSAWVGGNSNASFICPHSTLSHAV